MIMTDYKTQSEMKAIDDDGPDLDAIINNLTSQLRFTYQTLAKMNGTVHLGVIAEKIGISNGATTQRLSELIKVGLAERVQFGHYRAVK